MVMILSDMLDLQVCLHDILKSKVPMEAEIEADRFTFNMPSGSFVLDLLQALGLPKEWVGLVIVNGRQCNHNDILKNGDIIDIFSPMAGG